MPFILKHGNSDLSSSAHLMVWVDSTVVTPTNFLLVCVLHWMEYPFSFFLSVIFWIIYTAMYICVSVCYMLAIHLHIYIFWGCLPFVPRMIPPFGWMCVCLCKRGVLDHPPPLGYPCHFFLFRFFNGNSVLLTVPTTTKSL